MSGSASTEYEKPRSGRSICMLETPRSRRIASARTPFPASCPRTTSKSPRRKRVCARQPAWNCRKNGRASGSRSIAISFPRPASSPHRSDACPPAPKVASTIVAPGSTARCSRISSASTGTCSVLFGCEAFGNKLGTPFDLVEVLAPGGAIPDLEVVAQTRDDDLAREAGALDEKLGDHHAPLPVEVRLRRAGEEEAAHLARLTAERVQTGQAALDKAIPAVPRVDDETAVHPATDDEPVREGLPELGRKREAVLVVESMLVFAEEHGGHSCLLPLYPTLNHDSPLGKTAGPRRSTRTRRVMRLEARRPAWRHARRGGAAPRRRSARRSRARRRRRARFRART